jgi:hypothetical protein
VKHFVLAVLLLVSTSAFPKKKPNLVFDHVGKMTNHDPQMRYLLEGRTDLYEDDEYICTPGDEHHAPTCLTYVDWFVPEKTGYVEILLDDGSIMIVSNSPSVEDQAREPWKHDATTRVFHRTLESPEHPLHQLADDWEIEGMYGPAPETLPDGATRIFHYAVDSAGNIYIDRVEQLKLREAALESRFAKRAAISEETVSAPRKPKD